jgi:hypothetical protein
MIALRARLKASLPTNTAVVRKTLGDQSLERRIGKRQEGSLNRDGASARRYAAHFARAATSGEVSGFTFVLTLGAAEA